MTTSPRIELSKLFDDFIETYESLLSVTQEKQDAIFERDYDALEELVEKQAALTEQLQAIDERKTELAESRLESGEPIEGLTLRKLQEELSTPQDEHLAEKRLRLKELVRDVQRYSRENQRLLETRMDFFRELFEELSQGDGGETYDSDREKDDASADEAVLFDEAI